MTRSPTIWATSLFISLAWHFWWWGGIRIHPPARAQVEPPAGFISLALMGDDSSGPAELSSPALFAFPGGPGFSRYLNAENAPKITPRLDAPDLTLYASRVSKAATNNWVLSAMDESATRRLGVIPELPPHSAQPLPPLNAPSLSWESSPGWILSAANRLALGQLSRSDWSVWVSIDFSTAGYVEHVFVENSDGLAGDAVRKLIAVLRLTQVRDSGVATRVRVQIRNRASTGGTNANSP